MMTNREFKTIVTKVFLAEGFKTVAKNLRFDGAAATVLVGLQKLDDSDQYAINVGFWLHEIADGVPPRVELTHMYYRIERLVPARREQILRGMDLSDPEQPIAVDRLAKLLVEECIPKILRLAASMEAIRQDFANQLLENGLVRKEARALLTNPAS